MGPSELVATGTFCLCALQREPSYSETPKPQNKNPPHLQQSKTKKLVLCRICSNNHLILKHDRVKIAGTAQRKRARIISWKEWPSYKARQNIAGLLFGRDSKTDT